MSKIICAENNLPQKKKCGGNRFCQTFALRPTKYGGYGNTRTGIVMHISSENYGTLYTPCAITVLFPAVLVSQNACKFFLLSRMNFEKRFAT